MTCVEKGIGYELVPVAYGSEQHGKMHPFRRMPILEAEGLMLVETLAITGYLDEAYPGPSLQPDGPVDRARMRTWMGVCGDYLFRDVVRAIPRDRRPTETELTTARGALERAERLIDGDSFLVGPNVTLADLYLAPQLANCREKAPELLDGLNGLTAWGRLVEDRESFERTRPAQA